MVTFIRLVNPRDLASGAAQVREEAAALNVTAEKATDSAVRSVLQRLATDYTTAAEYMQANDGPDFSRILTALTADLDALSAACRSTH